MTFRSTSGKGALYAIVIFGLYSLLPDMHLAMEIGNSKRKCGWQFSACCCPLRNPGTSVYRKPNWNSPAIDPFQNRCGQCLLGKLKTLTRRLSHNGGDRYFQLLNGAISILPTHSNGSPSLRFISRISSASGVLISHIKPLLKGPLLSPKVQTGSCRKSSWFTCQRHSLLDELCPLPRRRAKNGYILSMPASKHHIQPQRFGFIQRIPRSLTRHSWFGMAAIHFHRPAIF